MNIREARDIRMRLMRKYRRSEVGTDFRLDMVRRSFNNYTLRLFAVGSEGSEVELCCSEEEELIDKILSTIYEKCRD